MDSLPVKAFLDTHAAVFLWEGRRDVWRQAVREVLQGSALFVSPLVRLELRFLEEIGRIKINPDEIMGGLALDCGVVTALDPYPEIVAQAMHLSWTRDPFDRLLVANAMLHEATFITRDRTIRANYEQALW